MPRRQSMEIQHVNYDLSLGRKFSFGSKVECENWLHHGSNYVLFSMNKSHKARYLLTDRLTHEYYVILRYGVKQFDPYVILSKYETYSQLNHSKQDHYVPCVTKITKSQRKRREAKMKKLIPLLRFYEDIYGLQLNGIHESELRQLRDIVYS